jgi:hypothetical protein
MGHYPVFILRTRRLRPAKACEVCLLEDGVIGYDGLLSVVGVACRVRELLERLIVMDVLFLFFHHSLDLLAPSFPVVRKSVRGTPHEVVAPLLKVDLGRFDLF